MNKAAELTGRSKKTIARDANEGRLPRTMGENGSHVFQLTDLLAFYGPFKAQPATAPVPIGDGSGTAPPEKARVTSDLSAALEAKDETIAALKAQIEELRRDRDSQVTDLRAERDRWHTAYEGVKMLPAPAAANDDNRGFFSRLFGGKR